jgi:hypothetical protein
MFTWVLETDVTFDDAIDDVLFDVSEDVKRSQTYRIWKELDDAIRAGGPIPNTYDQLWANVCLKYMELYLAKVEAMRGGSKRRSVKRRTYKKRKVQRKTRSNRK